MKKILLLIVLFHCALCAFSQNPLVKMWDYRFGGTNMEALKCIQQTRDGGYILGGVSPSGISGDKTQPSYGSYDYWIVKTDSLGNKQWDKDFGGTADDYLYSIQQTADGGYILGGYSSSGISGDKTQALWGGVGDDDYWIVKTDSLGIKQWDKDFGGIGEDYLYSIQQTSDGGYILGGFSASSISGNKTQATWGAADYWIVKTDSLGIIEWDSDLGGTDDENLICLQQTYDDGYILCGVSYSGINGDKTQATWGGADYWIVKTDSLGIRQWDKDFGGIDEDYAYSIQQTADGGYILGGWSFSGISGNKTQPIWGGAGDDDYWIVKTDSLGNKQWDKDFGGTANEELFIVSQTSDGGYLISGDSYSSISGDKTENNFGQEQTWVLKTDSLGIKQWDKTIFTAGHDENGVAVQTRDGCYTIANSTDGGIAGYKTQVSWNNSHDYWLIKFCDSTFLPPTATAFTDSLLCPGTCTDFTNQSFNATSYQWNFSGAVPPTSSDVNPTNICYPNPGSYDVQLIATNANGSDTLLLPNYITVFPTPPPQGIIQSGDTLFAIAGSASYQWYFNGNIINGATDYFYVALSSGDYNVVATDQNGCEVEAVINNVLAGNSHPDIFRGTVSSFQLAVFPNPVEDKFTIHNSKVTSGTAVEISIYNVLGERVLIHESRGKIQEEIIDVSKLGSGMYYLEVTSGEKIYRAKFVKQ